MCRRRSRRIEAYVAYVLASKYWGRGYAQRAMQAMFEHLGSAYDVDRYVATVEVENQRSIRLLERLGFQPIGPQDLRVISCRRPSACSFGLRQPGKPDLMQTIESLESQLEPLLPGLMGIHLSEAGKDRVVATMRVRPTCARRAECFTAAR